MEVGLGPGDFVRWKPGSPKKGPQPPHSILAHVCCNQTAGCIKVLLGTEVGLGPGDTVVDGDLAPLKGTQPPISAHVYCGQTVAHLSYC